MSSYIRDTDPKDPDTCILYLPHHTCYEWLLPQNKRLYGTLETRAFVTGVQYSGFAAPSHFERLSALSLLLELSVTCILHGDLQSSQRAVRMSQTPFFGRQTTETALRSRD